jgi:SAM-dependent methyltransferase
MGQISFDADLLPRLEAIYQTRDVQRRRRLVREALDAAPGERILDVGCGPGFYVTELLEQVGPSGAVVGVDSSPQMLAAAAHRNAGHANVTFHEADATELPIEDASFDALVCVQVLEYVRDTAAALAEMHRILRERGRVVVWDTDWSTVSIHSTAPDRMRRVLEAWDGHLAHPALPRTLAAQLGSAGFEDVRVEGHTFATTELVPGSFVASLLELVEQYVDGREETADDEARKWATELRDLGERGEFFFACIQFCFAARKPAGG